MVLIYANTNNKIILSLNRAKLMDSDFDIFLSYTDIIVHIVNNLTLIRDYFFLE